MALEKLSQSVVSVGVQDWHRRLFDELIPLPEGTSYNAYFIKGSNATALIDTVDPSKDKELLDNLDKLGITKLDYVVANHAEQDHSGVIPLVLKSYPEARVVTNAKCKSMLQQLLLIPEDRFMVISDGETISLGDLTLEFYDMPWVHWPETMVTFLREDRILFSCDFFGSHLASSSLFEEVNETVISSAKRYFAEITMPFSSTIRNHLKKVEELSPALIAPSHGPIHQDPSVIVSQYKAWTSSSKKPYVIIPFVSMHGSTRAMVDHLVAVLTERKIRVKPYDLTVTDIGELAIDLVDSAVLILGVPTVLGGPHPVALNAAAIVNALRPTIPFVGLIGSFGWGGNTEKVISESLKSLKSELLETVLISGYPDEADLVKLNKLADLIASKVKQIQ